VTPHVSITLLRTQSDDRLVKLTTAGHDRAFEAIVDRYRRPLLRYARRFLSEGRAEDVVQAAFVSAWSALGEGVEVRDLRPWLYRIVHNGALNAMKRPGGDDAPLIDMSAAGPGPEAEVEARDDVRRTLDGIAALPDRQRAALVAVAVDGRAHADVAAELGLTDTAVRQLVRRARVSLRAAATAVTPWPAAAWLAHAGTPHQDSMTTRIAEAVAGTAGTAGTAGLASGAVIKTGAIVATVGVIAAGAPQVEHAVHRRHPHHHAPAAAAATTAGVVHGVRAASTTAAVGGTGTGASATAPATPRTSAGVVVHRHRGGHRTAAFTFHTGSGTGSGESTSGTTRTPTTSPPTGSRHGSDSSGDGGGEHHGSTTSGSGRRDGTTTDHGPSSGSGDGSGEGTQHTTSGGDGSGSGSSGSGDSSTTTAGGGSSGDTQHADDSSGSGSSTGSSGSGDGTSGGSGSGGSHDSGSSDPAPPVSDH